MSTAYTQVFMVCTTPLIFPGKKNLRKILFEFEYLNKFENSTCIPQITVDFFSFLHSNPADNKLSKSMHISLCIMHKMICKIFSIQMFASKVNINYYC